MLQVCTGQVWSFGDADTDGMQGPTMAHSTRVSTWHAASTQGIFAALCWWRRGGQWWWRLVVVTHVDCVTNWSQLELVINILYFWELLRIETRPAYCWPSSAVRASSTWTLGIWFHHNLALRWLAYFSFPLDQPWQFASFLLCDILLKHWWLPDCRLSKSNLTAF